jgi:hypothetical protein
MCPPPDGRFRHAHRLNAFSVSDNKTPRREAFLKGCFYFSSLDVFALRVRDSSVCVRRPMEDFVTRID